MFIIVWNRNRFNCENLAHLFVNDFATVRAEFPIEKNTQHQYGNNVTAGFFYFEVKILQRNKFDNILYFLY
jgi:hypothetical protein